MKRRAASTYLIAGLRLGWIHEAGQDRSTCRPAQLYVAEKPPFSDLWKFDVLYHASRRGEFE